MGSKDRRLELFDGLRHETMNEPPEKRKKVLDAVAGWILERTQQADRPRVA
ncbi:MAG: hypothetical protein SWH68_06210 [Thermodesulfobacteriota bacterium]|nr:hypothetical protein [Thermodesulfobacteriota bacterium]